MTAGMEHQWSRAGATAGNRWQRRCLRNPLSYLRPVADGCHQLRLPLHGKEGVDGSSPSEGFAKVPQISDFHFGSACTFNNVHWVWSRLWSLQIWKRLVKPAFSSLMS